MKENCVKHEYNFSIFDNYKCDGQLAFIQNGNNLDIIEETSENKNDLINKDMSIKNFV